MSSDSQSFCKTDTRRQMFAQALSLDNRCFSKNISLLLEFSFSKLWDWYFYSVQYGLLLCYQCLTCLRIYLNLPILASELKFNLSRWKLTFPNYIFIIIHFNSHCYRPQIKFAKVMFSQVSVCPQWGGGLCPGGLCLPLDRDHTVTSRRYVSYWNAFLFYLKFQLLH